VSEVAQSLPPRKFRRVSWREGSAAPLSSRFAAVRIRAAHNSQAHEEQWMLIEWPSGDPEPRHYWFSTLPANTAIKTLVASAQGRWRIERDYQELKSELGLHHYEGRNWRGFHHHASLCIAAYGFLMRERLRSKKNSAQLKAPAVPKSFRPRGARSHATARSKLDRNDGLQSRSSDRKRVAHVSLLRHKRDSAPAPFLTQ
jgi:SRSO17 transposase